jgi:ubiquinone/menaquinone biosynthesis C-methylase UbiE
MPVGSLLTARMMAQPGRRLPRAPVGGDEHSQAFKDFEAAGWSANAPGYGRLTGRITALVSDLLLDAAAVGPGVRVVDVGCGTGALCAAAAARGAQPTGVDLAPGMVGAARRAHRGLEFVHGDAEALPLPDGAFGAALGAFVVNHVPSPEHAAAEVRRVLAPGGRVALAMWGPPERVPFLGLFDAAMRAADVHSERALPPGPAAFRFADRGALRALLETAGFEQVDVREHEIAPAVADAGELWEGVQTGSVRTAAQLRGLDDDERARVRGALERLLEDRRAGGGLRLETAVLVAAGVSPAA